MMAPLGQYAWLANEPGPKMLRAALELHGVREALGPANNPLIIEWAKECGIKNYTADETPWCGLFQAICAKRAGKPLPVNPLWARNWARWGQESIPELGATLVFSRGANSGHVGQYVGEDVDCYHVYAGNQGDQVSITRIPKDRLIACRAYYAVGKPANVRPIFLKPQGAVSSNER